MHVLLDDERLERLRARAASTGSSVGELIRTAIDRELADGRNAEREAAVDAFLAAPPLPIGTPEEVDRELEAVWDRKPWRGSA